MLTKRMIQTLMVVVALFATFATTPKASADFALTLGDFDANLPNGNAGPLIGPPVVDQNEIQAVNRTFTNTYTLLGNPGNVGNAVRTIVAGRIDSLQPGTIDPTSGPGDSPKSISFIAVLDGVVGPGNTVAYQTGRVGAFEVDNNLTGFLTQFQNDDPSTWGFDTGSFAATGDSGAFSEWVLAPQTDIISDTGVPLSEPVPAPTVNTSSVDSVTGNLLTEGRFLFAEDSPAGQDPGDDFISILNNLNHALNDPNDPNYSGSLVPPFANNNPPSLSEENTTFAADEVTGEGIFIDSADTVENSQFNEGANIDAGADLAILNAIGIWGTTNGDNPAGISVDGAPGTGFATSFGGAGASDYTPVFVTIGNAPVSITGDFTATGDLDIRPGVFAGVPEPTTALLGLMGLAGIGLRRRRNA